MYAGIMKGMSDKRKDNLTNRRETSRLFNNYVTNARQMGLELNEDDLQNYWNNNSNSINRSYAPSASRMKSIVAAQDDHLAQQAQQRQLAELQQQERVQSMVEKRVQSAFGNTAYNTDSAEVYQSIIDGFEGNQLLEDSFNSIYGGPASIGAAHKRYERGQLADIVKQMEAFTDKGLYDPKAIQEHFGDLPPHLLKAATDQAKQSHDRKLEVQSQADHTLRMGNRSSAQQAIVTMIKNGTDTPERVENVLVQWGVNDEEDRAFILEGAQELSRSIEQQDMESQNVRLEKRLQDAKTSNKQLIVDQKKANRENLQNHFGGYPASIKSAIDAVSNVYMLDSVGAQSLQDWINTQMKENENYANNTQQELSSQIGGFLHSQGVKQYNAELDRLNKSAQQNIGYTRFTPKQFKAVYIPSLEYELQDIVSRINRAVEVGNYAAYEAGQKELAVTVNVSRDELLMRQSKMKESFGSYANDQEVGEAIQAAAELLASFAEAGAAITPPKKPVNSSVPAFASEGLASLEEKLTNARASLDNFKQYQDSRGADVIKYTAEVKKLEAKIAKLKKDYRVQ